MFFAAEKMKLTDRSECGWSREAANSFALPILPVTPYLSGFCSQAAKISPTKQST
jgi:hypothetical protein